MAGVETLKSQKYGFEAVRKFTSFCDYDTGCHSVDVEITSHTYTVCVLLHVLH
jgi:hypothetical protein